MPYTVPTKYQLRDKAYYVRRVWSPARSAARNLTGRRAWADAMELLYDHEDEIAWKNGDPYRVPDIDGVFADPDNRWMSLFLEADASGTAPRRFSQKFDRLRLIRLYCLIRSDISFSEAA